MTAAPSPKLLVWIVFAAAALGAGVLLGKPALVAAGAPFALALLLVGRPPVVSVRVAPRDDFVREGEPFELAVTAAGPPGAWADVAVVVPPTVELLAPGNPVRLVLGDDGAASCTVEARGRRWGRTGIGRAVVRTVDPFGTAVREVTVEERRWVRIRPDPERLRGLLQPARTQLLPGDHPAPVVGTGVDFAALRPARAGDRVRDVSWRATARRGTALVVERHPDRSADIVLLLDSFGEEGLDDAVRGTFALATHHLRHRDRVGLVRFGGTSRWVRPGTGLRHLHELTEALLATEVFVSYAQKRIDIVPPRMLPAAAFVVAISPLEDERMLGALLDLRRRGVDVAAIEVPPSRWIPRAETPVDRLGLELWSLQRASLRSRFDALGVPVVEWAPGEAVETVVARLGRIRRRRRAS